MTRLHGRCPVGQRLFAKVPHGHWKTLTFVAGLRCDGIVAPCVFNRPINAKSFLAWVIEFLVPTLRPGDIVVMDNLTPHKNPQTLALIEQAGAQALFLPAYSPDLNPIEKMWSKVKNRLRSLAARTAEELHKAIATALAEVTAKDAASWFASCGYSFI
jgi:transposase